MKRTLIVTIVCVAALLISPSLRAEEEEDLAALAKKTQNPVSELISVPLQNNTNFGIGPHDRTQNVLNIQPVMPTNVGEWNLIYRTILFLIYQPDIFDSSGGSFSLGDINSTLFLPAAEPGRFIWGAGPIITANWKAESGDRWLAPFCGGVEKIFGISSNRGVLDGYKEGVTKWVL
jgi:hypothetical protein